MFGPETSAGIVQLFFGRMVEQLVAAAPRASSRPPVLAEDFERELHASLHTLFGTERVP